MSFSSNTAARPQYLHHDDIRPSSDEEGTYIGEGSYREGEPIGLNTSQENESYLESHLSPSIAREKCCRLEDDLELLRAEQMVSDAATKKENEDISRSKSFNRTRSRRSEPQDDFDIATNPLHTKTNVYKPPEHPSTNFAKFFKKVHNSSFLLRYFTYIVPVVLVILIPLLLGALLFKNASVGSVKLMWFSVWLEVVWLTLWAGRIVAKCIPYPLGMVSSLFTNNSKKWRDMGKQLEVPAALFFWWLAIEISFLPTMKNHHIDGNKATRHWESTMNKIIISVFAGVTMNFIEKIIMQLIAISFHLRTYSDRIDVNKFQISSLTKLYTYSKEKIAMDDSEFEDQSTKPPSGVQTPMAYLNKAQKNAREALNAVGDVAGKVAGDFTGKKVSNSTQPHQVVLMLLGETNGAQILARRLFRTFAREGAETVFEDDLREAFDNDEEAEAAFQMFDKDLNGDISMEELEAVCVEIGRERKSITASLKDLDSVVSKLDAVLVFIVIVITVLIFLSLISASTASILTSAGSTLLALSWLFATTAQEFLQSVIFVFVKHPFDVGDRVSIYGNTGSQGKGDDYFVKEIALLYTEFKKMEGQVVQAPNSYLNTLFILNMRRSGGLAEAVPVVVKFGTTLEQIDSLRQRLLEFVQEEKREYQGKILTELREVMEVHSITINVVFFYKSNWQNELLRLQRRNKFICALMVSMESLGIEGPRMREPGQKENVPLHVSGMVPPPGGQTGDSNPGPGPGPQPGVFSQDHNPANDTSTRRTTSILRQGSALRHGESVSAMSKRVDFSLGMRGMASGDMMSDVFEDNNKTKIPVAPSSPSVARNSADSNRLTKATSASSTGASGPFHRPSVDSQSRLRIPQGQSTHRNRFFSRNRSGTLEREATPADLESGAMAGIPESRPTSTIMRSRTDASMGQVPNSGQSSRDQSVAPEQRRGQTGQQQSADDVEMRRLVRGQYP